MAILASSLAMSFLYFGTWYVWISSAVSLIIYFYGMLDSVVDEVFTDDPSKTIYRIKKLSYVFVLLLPFLIGIISMADQASVSFMANFNTIGEGLVDILSVFYYGSIAVLTYKICIFGWCFPTWLLPIIALLLYIYNIVRKEFEIRAETKRNEIEKAVEARDAERLKDQKEKQITEDLIKHLYSFAINAEVTKEQLFFFAKNRKDLRFFPVNKLNSFDFELIIVDISLTNKMFKWEHDLEKVLEMFNFLYANESTSEDEIAMIVGAVEKICNIGEHYNKYKAFELFKKMLNEATKDMPKLWSKKIIF